MDGDRVLGMRAVPWSPEGSDNTFDIRAGVEKPAEMVPRSPGEVLMENEVARAYRELSSQGRQPTANHVGGSEPF